jgi:hypothetical protein
MDRRTSSTTPVYVVDVENDEWRVVIPVYRKLSPVTCKPNFGAREEPEACLSGADGQSTLAHIQARAPTTR